MVYACLGAQLAMHVGRLSDSDEPGSSVALAAGWTAPRMLRKEFQGVLHRPLTLDRDLGSQAGA